MLLNVRNPTVSVGDLPVSLTVDRVRGTMGSVEVQYQVIPTQWRNKGGGNGGTCPQRHAFGAAF